MHSLFQFFTETSWFLWGTPMLILVLGSGAILTFGTGFFQFKYFSHFMKNTLFSVFKKENKNVGDGHVSAFTAVATAIGGAVGVGNIGGVATAIAVGGPGALFWLWLAALLGMALKCAEITLAVYYRKRDENGQPYGGPTYYIQKGLSDILPKGFAKFAGALSVLYGIFFFCTFLTGIQGYTVAEGFTSVFDIDMMLFGCIYSVVLLGIVLGGGKRVVEFAGKIVPVMIVVFVALSLGILIVNFKEIPHAFGLIFAGAFTDTAAVGGFAGATMRLAINQGLARSVFSNEAGQGTSTMIHSQAYVEHPVKQGLWGMFEVFIDTVVICTIMSLVIITSGEWTTGLQGASLSISSFATVYGDIGGQFVAIVVLLFGITTHSGWFTYYDSVLRHAFRNNIELKNKIMFVFKIIYPVPALFAIYFATQGISTAQIWAFTDFFGVLYPIINIIVVVVLSKTVFKLFKDYKARYMGIGTVDPSIKLFYEDEENQTAEKRSK